MTASLVLCCSESPLLLHTIVYNIADLANSKYQEMLGRVLVLALEALCFVTLAKSAVLVDFQVAQPPPLPQDAKQCTVKILE